MKRLIIFLLLFAAIKVAGQTTGYLRFDTVKIMKQNGTCELYIMNKTKDSVGGILTNIGNGLTSFKRSRSSGDSLFIGGDTVVFAGGSNKLDSIHIYTAVNPDPDTVYQYKGGDSSLVGLIPKGSANVDANYIDSVATSRLISDIKISWLYNIGAIIIGNSISQGGTSPYETWANMLRKVAGGPWTNHSIAGGDANILGDMLRNDRIPINHTQGTIYNNHVNVIRFTQDTGVRKWVRNAVRSFLTYSFRSQIIDASAMSVIAGSWASFSGLTRTVTSKTDCRVTDELNAELSFNIRDGQPGLFIVFQTNGINDSNDWSDSVGIYRSGGTERIATVNLNKQAHLNGMPVVLWLPNTNVFSSIRIRNLEADTLVVDYAGTTLLNNNLSPALVAEITNVATAALQPGIGHDWWDTVNADIRTVVEDEFIKYGYPVATVDVNNGLHYDDPVYFHELLTTPTSAIHPSTYAHFNVLLPQALRKVTLRGSEKKSIEHATDVATYSAAAALPGQEKVIILPVITANRGLNYAADSFSVVFGQRLTVINDNSAAAFNWNAQFWTFLEPNGTTGTHFPNRTVTEMEWTRQGFRVTNRYGVDSVRVSNDTIYVTMNGKRHFGVLPGGGSGGTAGEDGYLQYDSSGFHGARSAYRVDNATNTVFAGDSTKTLRVVANDVRPSSGTVFGVRASSGNTITSALLSATGTALLNTASDASGNTTITSTIGGLNIFSASGTGLRLIASGLVSLNLATNSNVGVNETTPPYRFTSFENRTAQTASQRAIYGLTTTTYNTTGGAIVSAGVYGMDNSTRASGGNNLTNVGVYGLGQAGGQLSYGVVSEAMTSATNTVVPSMRIISNSTGTAANGFGTGFFLGAENGSAANVNIGEVQAVYTDVTNGSEDADINWRTVTNGSLTTKFSLIGGTGRFSGGLQLGSLSDGAGGTDSVLVINNTEVKKVAASTLGGGGGVTSVGLATGTSGTDIGVSGSPITSSGDITLNIPTASASNRGALSSSDWSTFNNKLSNITGLISAGTNISLSGTGASGDPYVISSGTGDLVIVNDADHTVTSTQSAIRYQNNITANRTVTLPNPSTVPGREIWVKWNTIDGAFSINITTVSGTALLYLDGTASSTSQSSNVDFLSILFKSDGTSWYKIN